MTSERQIAANRNNAARSTGPRSTAGRRRSARNAFKHGFASRAVPHAQTDPRLERLAREIAGATKNPRILECARVIAEAERELHRVRRFRLDLMGAVMASVFSDAPLREELKMVLSRKAAKSARRLEDGAVRCADALVGLNRYEHRATARRNKAARELVQLRRLSEREATTVTKRQDDECSSTDTTEGLSEFSGSEDA